jgi:hypothetical protein
MGIAGRENGRFAFRPRAASGRASGAIPTCGTVRGSVPLLKRNAQHRCNLPGIGPRLEFHSPASSSKGNRTRPCPVKLTAAADHGSRGPQGWLWVVSAPRRTLLGGTRITPPVFQPRLEATASRRESCYWNCYLYRRIAVTYNNSHNSLHNRAHSLPEFA